MSDIVGIFDPSIDLFIILILTQLSDFTFAILLANANFDILRLLFTSGTKSEEIHQPSKATVV